MITLTYSEKKDKIVLWRKKDSITSFNHQEFGQLVREVMRVMREADPRIERKRQRKAEREQLIKQLKILLTIKLIDFKRWFKSIFKKKSNEQDAPHLDLSGEASDDPSQKR